MIKNLTSIFVVLLCLIFSSCERHLVLSGKVVDSATNEPIDSVFVEFNGGKKGNYNKSHCETYTDLTGNYETSMMIGCAFGCYDFISSFSKTGYKTKQEFNFENGTVILMKE